MKYQLPPQVIDTNGNPLKYHGLDRLSITERGVEDERAVEDFLMNGTEPNTNVFVKHDPDTNDFVYITGELWETGHRFAGTVPDVNGQP